MFQAWFEIVVEHVLRFVCLILRQTPQKRAERAMDNIKGFGVFKKVKSRLPKARVIRNMGIPGVFPDYGITGWMFRTRHVCNSSF